MQNQNNDPSYIGMRYGRLTVIGIERAQKRKHGWDWVVRCDCGKEKVTDPSPIKAGKVKSCGCLHDELCGERARKFQHNVYKYRRLYGIYNDVKRRCFNPNRKRYKDYGGRGIVMCEEWSNPDDGFDKFVVWALSNGYSDDLTLERKDVNGNYSPENCEWITLRDQAKNKRDTKWVVYKGEKIRLIDLAEKAKVSYDTLHDRIYDKGWPVDKAVETPSKQANSLKSKCMAAGMNYGTVRDRIKKLGWSEERALSTPTNGRGANAGTYGFDFGEATCKVCGKKFKKNNNRQIYCGAKCRAVSKSASYRKHKQSEVETT